MSDSLPYLMPGGVGQRPLLVPAQVASSQGLPGGNMAPSSLASALLGRNSPMPGLQAPQIPLSTIMALMNSSGGQGLMNGLGNLLGGYQWDGMAGGSMLNGLSAQAAGNIAGGAAI